MSEHFPTIDVQAFRDEFHRARMSASQRAHWDASDPGAEPDTCRYCRRFWRRWAVSDLDGHAACIVPEYFKRRVGEILRSSPTLTYAAVAEMLGTTPGVVRSWAFAAGVAGPVTPRCGRKKISVEKESS
jgi:hypothetical protein